MREASEYIKKKENQFSFLDVSQALSIPLLLLRFPQAKSYRCFKN